MFSNGDIIKANGLDKLFEILKPKITQAVWHLIQIYNELKLGDGNSNNYMLFVYSCMRPLLEFYHDYEAFLRTTDEKKADLITGIFVFNLYQYAVEVLKNNGMIK